MMEELGYISIICWDKKKTGKKKKPEDCKQIQKYNVKNLIILIHQFFLNLATQVATEAQGSKVERDIDFEFPSHKFVLVVGQMNFIEDILKQR